MLKSYKKHQVTQVKEENKISSSNDKNRKNNSNNIEPIRYIQQRIDETFSQMNDSFGALEHFSTSFQQNLPQINIQVSDKEYVIQADLPGVEEEDINLEINNNTLNLIIGKHSKQTSKNGYFDSSYYFKKSFTLPKDINEENIKAVIKDGKLVITIPTIDTTLIKRIPINSK